MIAVKYFATDIGYVNEVVDRQPRDIIGFSHLLDDKRVVEHSQSHAALREMAKLEAAEFAVKHGLAPTDIDYDQKGEAANVSFLETNEHDSPIAGTMPRV